MYELLTTNDLAKNLNVSRQTIERWRKEGLPYRKIGKLVRFDADEVNKWIDAKK